MKTQAHQPTEFKDFNLDFVHIFNSKYDSTK